MLLRNWGGPENLEWAEVPEPKIGPDEVLVRVRAVAMNHLDLFVRGGLPNLTLPLPHILGSDVAGEVAATGDWVTDLEVGERVVVNPGRSCGECEFCLGGEDPLCKEYKILGEHVPGGYATHVAVPGKSVVRLPPEFPFEQAAAAPLVYMTAWRMLVTRARLRPGEDVLVIGAGSGVSTAAIQIAKLAGCTVYATSSSDAKLEKARALGADVTINHKTMEIDKAIWELTGKRGVDVAIDHVGKDTIAKSVRALRRGGRLLVCGATTGGLAEMDLRYLFWRHLTILGSTMSSHREFEEVIRLVFMGKLKPVVDKVFPLDRAREAHEYLERGDQFGKVVLVPPP